ncbi:class D sortase [Alkalihalobacterium elongatum]|uniref:class D sortase n=1 Tax=Alkalihalobacterium elongatum TaxID=2675466 RepID=UPI001C1F9838|nr:class D sortase [Alkalihalobacterium elongatum]
MRLEEYKTRRRKKQRLLLLSLCIFLFVGGLWFTTTNAYTFLKGYGLYKVNEAAKEVPETVEKAPASDKKEVADGPLYPVRPEQGELMGELYIPKLQATLPIYHGTDDDELDRGVGHFKGSVLPGEKDNSVLSGHRDTVFRKLGEVGEKDELVVTTTAGEFTYRINKVRIVDEDDRTVIVPRPRATLTVTTCYPFDFIGSAPERYVLEAHLIKVNLDVKFTAAEG